MFVSVDTVEKERNPLSMAYKIFHSSKNRLSSPQASSSHVVAQVKVHGKIR